MFTFIIKTDWSEYQVNAQHVIAAIDKVEKIESRRKKLLHDGDFWIKNFPFNVQYTKCIGETDKDESLIEVNEDVLMSIEEAKRWIWGPSQAFWDKLFASGYNEFGERINIL